MTYHTIPLIENSNQLFSLANMPLLRNHAILRGHYCATRQFCEAEQNRLVRAQTLPGFSDFSLRTIFLIAITFFVLNLQTWNLRCTHLVFKPTFTPKHIDLSLLLILQYSVKRMFAENAQNCPERRYQMFFWVINFQH